MESANLNIRFNYQIEDNTVELNGVLGRWMAIILPIALVASVIIILVGILVSNVLKVGIRGWFLRYWRGSSRRWVRCSLPSAFTAMP